MTNAPLTIDPTAAELHRLSALYGSGFLDREPQEALDSITRLAASLLACRVAMLTLLDHDATHVRSISAGAPPAPMPRAITMCDHTIRQPEVLVIPDLSADPSFADTPLVARGLRFYAGAPVHAPDPTGTPHPIGALCVIDDVPRTLDAQGRETLRRLAALADMLIAASRDARSAVGIAVEHERLVAELARQHRIFGQAERMAGIGSWRLSLADEKLEWSDGVFRIYGLPPGAPPALSAALDPYPKEARGRVSAALARAIEHCEPFDFEEDFHPVTGGLRRVRCLGDCEQVDGHNIALVGVFQDVTDRYRMETTLRRDADTDALTGLANRAAFDRALAAAMTRARDTQGGQDRRVPLLLVLVDLDGFKVINDTLGHAAGDDVLRQVGAALRALPFRTTLAARIGGDEFALLVEGDADADALAAELERALLVSATAGGLTLACSGSIGSALFDGEGSPRDFINRADIALYAVKRARVGERRRSDRRRAA
jgi:diguanylate cyclase (GGDEF)-like protein